jgi:hypothetical protein
VIDWWDENWDEALDELDDDSGDDFEIDGDDELPF